MLWRLLALLCLAGCAPATRCPALPASPERAPVHGLTNIQRTMRLLAESTAAQPNRVRILFYGQSITQSAWSRKVASDLHAKYPAAQLETQNRALGGFSSERLLETADSDLYPWQPDLVVFHVYGAHDKYQQLIERIRARTSAEVLLQTDHITRDEELDEPRCGNPPDAAHWSGFMNHSFLPSLVASQQVALCDLRAAWKAHLRAEHVHASTLLADAIHLNAEGDRKMAALVESCLVRVPSLTSPAERWVESLAPAARVAFHGTRLDVTVAAGSGFTRVRIDGAPPSSLGLATLARAHVVGADKWPPVHGIASQYPLTPELFTFTMRRDGPRYRFTLRGSVTGELGEGATDEAFARTLVIEPTDWDIDYAFELMGQPPPAAFRIELRAEPHAIDQFAAGMQRRTLTLAQGLAPGEHVVELEGDAPLSALTAYRAARDR
ncbi:MAG TPA: hypothetical protein VFX59_07350 [Polyangiales bacterium]|nr:hypothetical protein [Polyangiales bacterium]